jgi:predicted kinase
VLIILSGLPGVGKTAIARELVRATAGIHLRVDSIEQRLREPSTTFASVAWLSPTA